MPYIPEYLRKDLNLTLLAEAEEEKAHNAGQLNYQITMLCKGYIDRRHGASKKSPSYWLLNEVIGVLECAKQEMYRRVVAKVEDEKIEENGDVY